LSGPAHDESNGSRCGRAVSLLSERNRNLRGRELGVWRDAAKRFALASRQRPFFSRALRTPPEERGNFSPRARCHRSKDDSGFSSNSEGDGT
jgi:hypothetical protein